MAGTWRSSASGCTLWFKAFVVHKKVKKYSQKGFSDGLSYSTSRKSKATRGNATTHPQSQPIYKCGIWQAINNYILFFLAFIIHKPLPTMHVCSIHCSGRWCVLCNAWITIYLWMLIQNLFSQNNPHGEG